MRRLSLPTLTLLIAPLLAGLGAARSIIVVPDDAGSLQSAVNLAADGDTILVKPGTYTVHNLRLFGKAITLASEGGPGAAILDGNLTGRALFIKDGEGPDTVLDGFLIRNGRAPFGGGTIGDGGGAALVTDSSPTFRNCRFEDNAADAGGAAPAGTNGYRGGHGGAVYLDDSSARFENCSFERNDAGAGGTGGTGSTGSNGTLFFPTGGTGGTGKPGGRGGHGGAVYVVGNSSPAFVNTIFHDNEEGRGGQGGRGGKGGNGFGLSAKGGNGGTGGTGGQGGDGTLFVDAGAAALVVNCTFLENFPGQRGFAGQGGAPGSASAGSGNPGPSGSQGALGICTGVRSVGVTDVFNSVLWDTLFTSTPEISGNVIVWYSDVYGGYAGVGNFDLAPNLDLSTFEPLPTSPLLEAADDSAYPAWAGDRDFAGAPRSFDRVDLPGLSAMDIGAVEHTDGHQVLFPEFCQINPPGSLSVLSGTSEVAQTIEFGVDNPTGGQEVGSLSLLLLSIAPAPGDCGLLLPGLGMGGPQEVGSFIPDPTKLLPILTGSAWQGPGMPAGIALPLPNDEFFVGVSIYVQGALFDPSDSHLGLGTGMRMVIGT